jgi:FtsH-binding integral membrane protein
MGIFAVNYLSPPNTTPYDQSAIRNTINTQQNQSSLDAFTASVGFFGMAIGFILGFAGQEVNMFNSLSTIFHIPLLLVTFLAGLLGLMWLAFFIQLVSRMGWGLVKD